MDDPVATGCGEAGPVAGCGDASLVAGRGVAGLVAGCADEGPESCSQMMLPASIIFLHTILHPKIIKKKYILKVNIF